MTMSGFGRPRPYLRTVASSYIPGIVKFRESPGRAGGLPAIDEVIPAARYQAFFIFTKLTRRPVEPVMGSILYLVIKWELSAPLI
jgi:hypothetical protein